MGCAFDRLLRGDIRETKKFINHSVNQTTNESVLAARTQRGLIDSLGVFGTEKEQWLNSKMEGPRRGGAGPPGALRLPGSAEARERAAPGVRGGVGRAGQVPACKKRLRSPRVPGQVEQVRT